MTKGQFILTLTVAAVFGLIGGASVNVLGINGVASAQDTAKPKSAKEKKPAASADGKDKIVTAKEFRLVGEGGKVVAKLATGKHREAGDHVTLTLSDVNGKDRVRVYAAEKGTGLDLCDEEGKSRVVLLQNSVGAQGSKCAFQILDADGQIRIGADLSAFGALTCKALNGNGSGAQLFASVFKEAPFFQLVGNGGSEVFKAPAE